SPLLPPETQDSLRSGLANSLSTTGLSPARIVQLCPAHCPFHYFIIVLHSFFVFLAFAVMKTMPKRHQHN
ncbi:hypothetical protein, partial [Photorhabdus sp. RM96S]|uniref:hypothetical protein n=1 Tax=Photorhabdus sp. RM96S TaxID=3342822 RepID=UPI0036DDCC25